MIRRTFFAWYDARHADFRLSTFPPDAPVRPSKAFLSAADLLVYAQRKRGTVMWYPPLTKEQEQITIPYEVMHA